MQLGIMSTSLDAKDLPEALTRSSQGGFDGLEYAYVDNKSAKALSKKTYPKQLSKLSRESGLAIPSICLGMLASGASLIGTDEQITAGKATVKRALEVASEAHVETVLVPFFGKNAIEVEDELLRAADSLLDLSESAEQAGVVIGVESTLNFDQQEFLLDHLGNSEYVRMYVDTGNALARKLDFATGIRDLGTQGIAQIHFKDVKITEGNPPDYDVHLGEGDVDFHAAARAIHAIGYDGWVILETPPGDDPIASGKANLAFARDVLSAAAQQD